MSIEQINAKKKEEIEKQAKDLRSRYEAELSQLKDKLDFVDMNSLEYFNELGMVSNQNEKLIAELETAKTEYLALKQGLEAEIDILTKRVILKTVDFFFDFKLSLDSKKRARN